MSQATLGTSPSRTASARKRSPLLPESASRFLKRRLVEAIGLGIMAIAAAIITALVSYDPADPSMNAAVPAGRGVANWLGHPGALAADLFSQTLGLAAFALWGMVFYWGVRVMAHVGLTRPVLRLSILLLTIVIATVGLAWLPAPPFWTATETPGGWVGVLGLDTLTGLVHPYIGAASHSVIALTGLVLAPFGLAVASGISWPSWRRGIWRVGRGMRWLVLRGWALLLGIAGLVGVLWRRSRDPVTETTADTVPPVQRRRQRRQAPPLIETEVSDEDPVVAGSALPLTSADPPPASAAPDPADTAPSPTAKEVTVVLPRTKTVTEGKRATEERQPTFSFAGNEDYELPPLDLLQLPDPKKTGPDVSKDALSQNAGMLETVLKDYGVKGEIVKVHPGPVVTLYELEPAPGIKSSRVIGLADDIARSMSAVSVRVAVVPGRSVIGIELPNRKREMVFLRELLASDAFERTNGKLTLILGKDIGGQPVIADLARMPHLLIAGTTGSGKSVGINVMILSLLYRLPPERVRLILIDPKMLELSVYDDIPHLLAPVVTDPSKAVVALKWVVREMEDRYRAMSKLGVRNIEGYNARLREAKSRGEVLTRKVQTGFDAETGKPVFEDQPIDLTELPYIVVVVDEMADLMLVAGKDIEAAIQRLAQMARAAGIHLIMATQRPSVDVITGTIKANFPTRISFAVTSKIDSRTILGEQGAEQLLGQGDMLHMAAGGRINRVHGPFVSDDEVEMVVRHLKAQGEPSYIESVTEETDDAGPGLFGEAAGGGDSGDQLYDQAVALVAREGKCSTSFVQRHLQIGYNRAARIVERMEAEGVVSKANHVGKREVLVGEH